MTELAADRAMRLAFGALLRVMRVATIASPDRGTGPCGAYDPALPS
jgi:hypothetical protein